MIDDGISGVGGIVNDRDIACGFDTLLDIGKGRAVQNIESATILTGKTHNDIAKRIVTLPFLGREHDPIGRIPFSLGYQLIP